MDSSTKKKIKVVIIGAGASGLGAARWLTDNDVFERICIEVLEARNRVGGRVHTNVESAGPENSDTLGLFDLGASWLHDPTPTNPLCIMAQSLNLPLKPTEFGDDVLYSLSGKKYSDREATTKYEAFEHALFVAAKKSRKNIHAYKTQSLEDVVCRQMSAAVWSDPLIQHYASGMDFDLGASLRLCSSTECIDGHWISAEEKSEEEEDDDPIFLTTGFAAIMDGLVSGAATDNAAMHAQTPSSVSVKRRQPFSISFNTVVTKVAQSDGKVLIYTRCAIPSTDELKSEISENQIFEADAVICTLPLGVLKSHSVEFIPELSSSKLHAIDATGVGNVVKIVTEFPKVFWPTHTTFFGIADQALNLVEGELGSNKRGLLTSFLNGFKVGKKKILIGYAVGDGARVVDEMDDDELLNLVMSRVACFAVPGQVIVRPSKMLRTRWSTDPFSLGAYSYWAVGNESGMHSELGRREGNIWFAGEAVHENSLLSSSVRGAWASGVEAAADICRHFNVDIVTPVMR